MVANIWEKINLENFRNFSKSQKNHKVKILLKVNKIGFKSFGVYLRNFTKKIWKILKKFLSPRKWNINRLRILWTKAKNFGSAPREKRCFYAQNLLYIEYILDRSPTLLVSVTTESSLLQRAVCCWKLQRVVVATESNLLQRAVTGDYRE